MALPTRRIYHPPRCPWVSQWRPCSNSSTRTPPRKTQAYQQAAAAFEARLSPQDITDLLTLVDQLDRTLRGRARAWTASCSTGCCRATRTFRISLTLLPPRTWRQVKVCCQPTTSVGVSRRALVVSLSQPTCDSGCVLQLALPAATDIGAYVMGQVFEEFGKVWSVVSMVNLLLECATGGDKCTTGRPHECLQGLST